MLQDLDLGALGIPLQERIQPFQFGHDPRGVHPRRRERRCLLDGRPLSPASLERRLDRPQLSANGGRIAPCCEKPDEVAGLALEAVHLARQLGCPGVLALEDGIELGVDHAGKRVDHGGRQSLPELGKQRPFKPLLAVPRPMCTDRRPLCLGKSAPVNPVAVDLGPLLPRGGNVSRGRFSLFRDEPEHVGNRLLFFHSSVCCAQDFF